MEKLQDAYTKEKLETTHFHHTYKRYSESQDYPIVHEYWSKTTTYDEQQWTSFFKKLGKFRRIIPFFTEVYYELQVGLSNNRFFSYCPLCGIDKPVPGGVHHSLFDCRRVTILRNEVIGLQDSKRSPAFLICNPKCNQNDLMKINLFLFSLIKLNSAKWSIMVGGSKDE
ncbi:unnamed protein product [Ambrosiozyma monospora]|uniref:Unnamed protein product n=1 Tax=Ambrosiozyma monospora TaxID=43982 RepID=A0ACB5SYN6_AMBMO|nr:unnamed protein product [Ambrosiozyma monospora]